MKIRRRYSGPNKPLHDTEARLIPSLETYYVLLTTWSALISVTPVWSFFFADFT